MSKINLKGFSFLILSIILETFATSSLKMSDGMQNAFPMILSILFFLVSLFFLGLCLEILPLSIAYAVWSGLGTILTVLVSMFLWGEVMNAIKISGVLLIITGVIMLNLSEEKAA